jgi:molecular chaperone IbpA
MSDFDLSPFWRSTVGFDQLFDHLGPSPTFRAPEGYPPYDIVRTGENAYRITLAVAGFRQAELSITAEQEMRTVEGLKTDKDTSNHLYHGITSRSFRRQFNLADHVQVKSASVEDGLLQIDLVREIPEAMKPRRIEIGPGERRDDKQLGIACVG